MEHAASISQATSRALVFTKARIASTARIDRAGTAPIDLRFVGGALCWVYGCGHAVRTKQAWGGLSLNEAATLALALGCSQCASEVVA